ncbi:hypothetical protein GCM10023168_23990 [Fodinibacter luteus]|uniref:Coenzyme PQQ synthesis protein D (PqqD) n=1 Tax=Fodinibacter luteus TaxID=552064 RepID=A0ABP8KJL8_9MICO
MTGYRIPARLAHVVPDGAPDPPSTVFIMQLPDGVPAVLRDSGAWIWTVAAGGEEDVAGAIAELVGLTREAVADDVSAYLDDLVGRGLLEVDAPSRNGGPVRVDQC